MWKPRRLTTIWAFTACYRGSFTFTFSLYIQPSFIADSSTKLFVDYVQNHLWITYRIIFLTFIKLYWLIFKLFYIRTFKHKYTVKLTEGFSQLFITNLSASQKLFCFLYFVNLQFLKQETAILGCESFSSFMINNIQKSLRISYIGKDSLHMSLHCILYIKYHQISHAVNYSNFSEGKNF
jgi:hypothetical protein